MTTPTAAPSVEKRAIVARGPWALAWRRLRRDRVAMVSGVVLILLCLMAILAPLISSMVGQDPNYEDIMNGLNGQSLPIGPGQGGHLLGTDQGGRDLLIRIVYGARVSLGIGLLSTALAVIIGVGIGLVAGYLGGVVDIVLARFMDVVLSMPFLLVGLGMVAIFGQKVAITVFVIAFFSWASMARIVRGQVLSLREREFVEAARSLGAGNIRIMLVDVLPNLLMPVIIYASLTIPIAVVSEATLAFLGLGVPAPTADWGDTLNAAANGNLYEHAWWMVVFPGIALIITTLAFNLLGDGIRDAFDPNADRLLKK
ncbi:ABC transporter permease [Nocardioides montaniterrae]